MTYSTVGASLPDPVPGRPTERPLVTAEGREPPPVLVHTELGVPIFFDPQTRLFSAQVAPVQGKGSNSLLHSEDFAQVVERIRERTLVVPVEGYLLSVESHDEAPLVRVTPCTVVEYHARRYQPFVIRVTEQVPPGRRRGPAPGIPQYAEKLRSAGLVYLPHPEHIARLEAAEQAVHDEEARHADAMRRLRHQVTLALEAIPQLTGRDVRFVQQSRQQLATAPEALGATLFDLTDEDPDEDPERIDA